jgi:cytochrome c5
MKMTSSVSLAAAVLLSTVAFSQTPSSSGSSASDNGDIMQNNAPANQTPSKASDEGTGNATPQSISQACHKQASDKKLTGDDKTNFIKQCKQGKTSRSGS